jgi:hypothetical protein
MQRLFLKRGWGESWPKVFIFIYEEILFDLDNWFQQVIKMEQEY